MEKEVIGYCPVCNDRLIATKLTCNTCNLDMTGDFQLPKFSYLTKDEQAFTYLFLQSEGSFKDVQAKLGITYLKAKQILSGILVKLSLKEEREEPADMKQHDEGVESVLVNENDHFVVKRIKEKLNKYGGTATIPMISAGKEINIWFDPKGNGLACDKIPVEDQLTWEVFIASYNIAVAQDGELYKGYARSGRLGSEKLPINSLEGYVAHAVHGVNVGESAFSPGFVIAAILDWAGIFINERGSTLKLVSENVFVESYQEAKENAETFLKGLDSAEEIQVKLSAFRHWYYFKELDGFAPSKFIGYKKMDMKAYQAGFNTGLDGRDTERILQTFFTTAEGTYYHELNGKLERFLAKYQKDPNALTQIHIAK